MRAGRSTGQLQPHCAGHSIKKIMEELMKSLEAPKQDDQHENEVPKEVQGILAAHIKSLTLVDSEIDPSMVGLLQLKFEVCGHAKCIPLSDTMQDGLIPCDRVRHFAVELPEESDSPRSTITVELLISSPLLPGSGSVAGKALLHIHDIIHDSPVSGQCELKDDAGALFAVVSMDLIFAYGNFGFGESFQLKHPVHKPVDYLRYSAFPRLTPAESRTDMNGLTLTPHPVKHPTFIPFDHHASLCVHEPTQETTADHSPRLLMAKMSRLQSLHRQLKGKRDRRQRLRFLEELILSSDSLSGRESEADIGVTARTPHFSMDRPL